jgi:ribonuclease R
VEFDISECEILMNADGSVKDVQKRKRLFSHKLIEEFMLAANETVAKHYESRKVPFVYRVHEAPPSEKVENLNAFLSGLGIEFTDKPKSEDYAKLIENLPKEINGVVNRVALRSMSKAEYRAENLGHFGLAAEYYCHFTSPIRRYPDLAIHRIIKYCLKNEKDAEKRFSEFVVTAAKASSECEKRADEAERKVDDLLKAKFMQDKIGNEYDAIISGVTEWGLFAELDNGVEGMIRVEALKGGRYAFDERRLLVSNGQYSYRIGDEIKIKVSAVNGDKVAFELCE